jgi:hypothetical protein
MITLKELLIDCLRDRICDYCPFRDLEEACVECDGYVFEEEDIV